MQRLEVSGAVRPIYGSLGFKRLMYLKTILGTFYCWRRLNSALWNEWF